MDTSWKIGSAAGKVPLTVTVSETPFTSMTAEVAAAVVPPESLGSRTVPASGMKGLRGEKRLKERSWSSAAAGRGSLSARTPAAGAGAVVPGAAVPGVVAVGAVVACAASGGGGCAKRDLYILGPCQATRRRKKGRSTSRIFFCLASLALA